MNLLDKVSSTDELIDLSISILQEAKNNGFNGFGGMCAQATVIINELLFDGKQINFASFNKSLEKKNQYIGHVACLVELNADEYVIFDTPLRDALLTQKSFSDVQKVLRDRGFQSMWEKGLEMVKTGQVALSEIIHVVGKD